MKAAWILTIVLAAGATAYGQTAPSAAPASSNRDNLRMMEGVLTTAVKNGADSLGRQMQVSEPGSVIVTGTARARGFALDGYGVFFVVDVPMMKQSVIWSNLVLMREQQREVLRRIIANNPDSAVARNAEMELRKYDRVAGAPSAVAQPAQQGTVVAQTLTDTAGAAAPDPRDPNELYTEYVKTALIDAMLNFGSSLIGPDEWLTIAAADSEGPPTPGQFYDASTIVLRVKGSDLAAFHAGKLTKEEVRKKVEIREF